MNAKPSISRKTFLRMSNQIQRDRKSYDTPDRDALALYGQLKGRGELLCFCFECEHIGPRVMPGHIESQKLVVNFIQIQISDD